MDNRFVCEHASGYFFSLLRSMDNVTQFYISYFSFPAHYFHPPHDLFATLQAWHYLFTLSHCSVMMCLHHVIRGS